MLFISRCIVPSITVLTPILDYSRCFLKHPYQQSVSLQNDSDLPAKYELVRQHVDELTQIIYSSPQPKVINPYNTEANFVASTRWQRLFENHLNLVKLVFIGKLLLSTLE